MFLFFVCLFVVVFVFCFFVWFFGGRVCGGGGGFNCFLNLCNDSGSDILIGGQGFHGKYFFENLDFYFLLHLRFHSL